MSDAREKSIKRFRFNEALEEDLTKARLDLEQANKENDSLKALEDHLNKRDMLNREALAKANKDKRELAESLRDCAELLEDCDDTLSENAGCAPSNYGYKELANKFLKDL